MASVLVTGAHGFVGRALCARLEADGHSVRRAIRSNPAVGEVALGNIDSETDWRSALHECDWVFHLAARVHIMQDATGDPLAEFRKVNTAGTLNLATQAAASGVRRFIYVSSIKVNGENGSFAESDLPHPVDSYGISKWEAEQGFSGIAAQTGMEVVIVRPPLIYGPGVKANFLRLLQCVSRGVPLPLGSVRNLRSMIYLGNLVDALMLVAMHPAAVGGTWLVSDGEDISTSELIRRIASAMGKSARLWSVPTSWVLLVGKVLGKTAEVERLTGSLQVDIATIQNELGWTPPYSMTQGLAETVRWYRSVNGGLHG